MDMNLYIIDRFIHTNVNPGVIGTIPKRLRIGEADSYRLRC
jgi:hypothetical protein